jgi:hypothetical protein
MPKNEGPMGSGSTGHQGSGKGSSENINPTTGPVKSLGGGKGKG